VKYTAVKFVRYVIFFLFYFIYVTTGIRTRDSGIQAAESFGPDG